MDFYFLELPLVDLKNVIQFLFYIPWRSSQNLSKDFSVQLRSIIRPLEDTQTLQHSLQVMSSLLFKWTRHYFYKPRIVCRLCFCILVLY